MSNLILLLQTYGVLIVFGIVLIEQIGMPIPAMPILIVAGALAAGGEISWLACLAASMTACLISDLFWFNAGRFYGKRILRLLCKISLSPDYCVSQTEDRFHRFGAKSLIVAKFILFTIASPMAGAMGKARASWPSPSPAACSGAAWASASAPCSTTASPTCSRRSIPWAAPR
jgi:membrane protein DedA with SNARE-associated domain